MPEGAFAELVRQRYSCRAYKSDPVPREHLEKMLEAARLAPSSCNTQPWRFAVVTASAGRAALVGNGLMPGLPRGWIAAAPVIVAMGMVVSAVTHRLAPLLTKVDYPWVDLGIAGEHLVLQAAELGLGTCWIGWIRPGRIRKIVGWPRTVRPVALITVGWPQPGANESPRPRKALAEIASWLD